MNSTKFFSVLVAVLCICSRYAAGQTTEGYEIYCPPDEEEAFFSHHNCSLYYHCANGIPYLRECSSDLYFNPETNECDYRDNVSECRDGTRPTEGTTTPSTTTTTTSTTTTSTTTTTTTTEATIITTEETIIPTEGTTDAPFCPPTGVHDFPYPGNCSLFIRCIGGSPFTEQCAEGLLFDRIDRVCKPAADAVCDEEVDPPTTTPEPGEYECPPTGNANYPHKSNCSMYYLCLEGQLFIRSCAFGLYFDATPNVLNCNFAETAVCDSECPEAGIHYRPIRTAACDYYKVCFEGSSVNLRCADGTVYHPVEQRCVHIDSYTCPYIGMDSFFL
jgi:hypothetical protein